MKSITLRLPFKAKRIPGPRAPELPIPKTAINWLVISQAIIAAYHISHVHPWIIIASLWMGIYAYYRILKDKPPVPQWLRVILTTAAVAGVMMTYQPFLGRDPGISTLLLLSNLKMMELKTRANFLFNVFMCYFLLFGNFLYDQSLQDLTFTLVVFIIVTMTMLRLNHPENLPIKSMSLFKHSFRLLLLSVPFTTALFLLFPRTYGPMWNLPEDKSKGISGFSDSIHPGQIAEMALSTQPVFQVEFPDNNIPVRPYLYFRGLLLWHTDGIGWYQGNIPSYLMTKTQNNVKGIKQRFSIMPSDERWLFALDHAIVAPRYSRILPGGIFVHPYPIKRYHRYEVISQLKPEPMSSLPPTRRKWALQLPSRISPRIQALAQEWVESSSSHSDIIRKAEQFFKTSGFVYTLQPGPMNPKDPLDDFLFNRRQGCCEHYAAAFTLLMRYAGIPSRVVLGYQGGEYNDAGDYLQITQADAHAWSEIWLEGRGWLRIDPTAWVSPERIQYGLAISQQISSLRGLSDADRSNALQKALERSVLSQVWKFIKNHWDNIRYKWDTWIISYDIFSQRNLFESLGFGRIRRNDLLIISIIVTIILTWILAKILKRQAPPADPLTKLYHQFANKLKRSGLRRYKWEGPLDFEKRAGQKWPQKTDTLRQFTNLFVNLRYGRLTLKKNHLKQLKQYIRKL